MEILPIASSAHKMGFMLLIHRARFIYDHFAERGHIEIMEVESPGIRMCS